MTPPYDNDLDDDLIFDQVDASFQITIQATESGDILRFKSAVLAVSEINRNRDSISPENIKELAGSLAGRAIDINHDDRSNVGVITAARAVTSKGKPAVSIDGILWHDRYPEEVDGVRAGTHHLSVEADAEKAVCSSCKHEFSSSDVYCDHLKNRRLNGTHRGFIGLKGKGAGITTKPAGTDTHFDRSQIYVVAHQESDSNELEAGWLEEALPAGKTRDDMPDSDFADPAGRRFPYKVFGKPQGADVWKSAYSAASGGHTGKKDEGAIEKLLRDKPAGVEVAADMAPIEQVVPYSQEMNTMMKCPHCGKEVNARDGKCPDCGKSMTAELLATELKSAEDSIKAAEAKAAESTTALATKDAELKSAMAELEALKASKKDPDNDGDNDHGKMETAKEQADEEDAKIKKSAKKENDREDGMKKIESQLEAKTAELTAKQVELDAANAKLTEIKNKERESVIKPMLTEAAWTERSAKFLAMDDEMFETVAASLKETAKKAAPLIGLRSGMPDPVAGSGSKSDNGNHAKLSLR